MNSVGPNVPPTPPPALVNDIENTLRKNTPRKKIGTTQSMVSIFEKKDVPTAASELFIRRSVSTP